MLWVESVAELELPHPVLHEQPGRGLVVPVCPVGFLVEAGAACGIGARGRHDGVSLVENEMYEWYDLHNRGRSFRLRGPDHEASENSPTNIMQELVNEGVSCRDPESP